MEKKLLRELEHDKDNNVSKMRHELWNDLKESISCNTVSLHQEERIINAVKKYLKERGIVI